MTPERHRQLATTSRPNSRGTTRAAKVGERERPGRPARTPTRPGPARQRSARVHWPSWHTHRDYVRKRRQARRLRRRSRSSLPGRHPFATCVVTALVLLTPAEASLAGALNNPALGLSVTSRFAEWLRSNGGGPIVTSVENWWYSHHPPPVGGRPSAQALPNQQHIIIGTTGSQHSSTPQLPAPAPITPFAHPALRGEGAWRPVGRLIRGVPAVYETFLRPDAVHTSVIEGVAWLDTKLLSATLYSGSYIPGGGPYKYTAPIQPSAARTLVVAFNAGFRMQDANGGYYTQGKTVIPLRTGGASFVIYRNGNATVASWGTEVQMTPDVVAVRQNLTLLVDNGQPVAGLNANDTTKWGNTLGNQVYVSRSGIGVTSDGALVYVGGPNLNIVDLANLLVRAGAVRAMELDINTDWVNFATFAPSTPNGLASPTNGTDLLPLADMVGPPSRYFVTWWARDFITLSARWP